MTLSNSPDLVAFLSTVIADGEPDQDLAAAATYRYSSNRDRLRLLIAQAKAFLDAKDLSLEDLGTTSNRWFGDSDEARAWLTALVEVLEQESNDAAGGVVGSSPKDSNGTPLAEGDTVMVIKDLNVKGGSSDLKRGTVIKKIHLVDDPEVIECRVGGSTLVLKTCFLKKA